MMRRKKGSVTVVLALMMMTFLMFCLVLTEGVRVYYVRAHGMQAMELAQFSVLSEFQKELFEQYGLFFLDLDYEQGTESIQILEQRVRNYLDKNTKELVTNHVLAEKFRRATDGQGTAFFMQAVKDQKRGGVNGILEHLMESVKSAEIETTDLEAIIKEQEQKAKRALERLQSDEEETDSSWKIDLPKISFPSIDVLTEAVFGSTEMLSEKSIRLNERIRQRELNTGDGTRINPSAGEMQLFHKYILKNCYYYGARDPGKWKDSLEYQVEYIISGKDSDYENLEAIMWKIFLSRAVGNYLFYPNDAEKVAKARAEAFAMVGIFGDGVLIESVKELCLISMAIEDGIWQTKQIFAGEKVPLYQKGIFSGIFLGYEEYLLLFLNTVNKTQKIYRCMDVIELETRIRSGYENFRLDHCVDAFELQWEYRFSSLFAGLTLSDGGIYENQIIRKVYYKY